jgi:hypothetical protein
MKYLNESFEYFKNKKLNEAAYIPSNIEEFAKRRGALPLVKTVARWAEKAGKRINGGTAIGKGYDTLILDLTYQGSEIRINLSNDKITLNDIEVKDAKSFKNALDESLNEGRVQYKRRYTDNHPAQTMNSNTKIRSRILTAVGDGVLTEDELKGILKELNANPRWMKRNANLFKLTENGFCLSSTGKRMSRHIQVSNDVSEEITESFNGSTSDAVQYILNNYKKITGSAYNPNRMASQDTGKIERFLKQSGLDIDAFWEMWLMRSKLEEELVSESKALFWNRTENKGIREPYRLGTEDFDITKAYHISNIKTGRAYDGELGFDSTSDRKEAEKILQQMYQSGKLNEGAMSDIDLLAQDSKDFKDFVKNFKKDYKNIDSGNAKELEAWLKSVYDGAKNNQK